MLSPLLLLIATLCVFVPLETRADPITNKVDQTTPDNDQFVPLEISADPITNTFSFTVDQVIPDNDQTGFADTHIISTGITSLSRLQLTLNISGGYNGDLYAYVYFTNSVQQSSAFTVLLNRSGRTASDDSGYADSGFDVTFDDQAPNGDIHTYETVIDPLGGELTGLWQPDARNVNPDFSLDTTLRLADMSGFTGLDPNGSWTLFVADDSPLGVATLQSWQISVISVPEPTSGDLAILSVSLLLAFGRTRPGKTGWQMKGIKGINSRSL